MNQKREGTIIKLGAILGIIGTILYIFSAIYHGDPPIESAETFLQYLEGTSLWREIHLINILAVFVWLASFILLTSVIKDPLAAVISKIANAFMVMTSAVYAIYMHIHAWGMWAVTDKWAEASQDELPAILTEAEALLTMLGSTGFIAQAMLGLTFALYGLTALVTPNFKNWIGFLGLIVGTGWLIGALLINFMIIVPFLSLSWIWIFIICITLYLKSNR